MIWGNAARHNERPAINYSIEPIDLTTISRRGLTPEAEKNVLDVARILRLADNHCFDMNRLWNLPLLKRIEFIFLNYYGFAPPRYTWCRSEEFSSELRGTLAGLQGLKSYVGICGGGDQHFLLLSELLKNNALSKVVLVDNQAGQLLHFKEMASIFNSYDGEEYLNNMYFCEEFAPHPSGWRSRKPEFKGKINATGVLHDIVEYVRDIKEHSKYFFYFSNALFYYIPTPRSSLALSSIAANGAVDKGSVVMTVGLATEFNLLRKESDASFSTLLGDFSRYLKHIEGVSVNDPRVALRQ